MFWFEADHPETGEPVGVEAVRYGARQGLRDCFGAPLEADDAEEWAICRVCDGAGRPLPYHTWREVENAFLEQARRVAEGERAGSVVDIPGECM